MRSSGFFARTLRAAYAPRPVGRLLPVQFVALALALFGGFVPCRVCVSEGEGQGRIHVVGHHDCDRHHDQQRDGTHDGDHDGTCCSDSEVDLRAPDASVALAPSAPSGLLAVAADPARTTLLADSFVSDPGLRERESVVLTL
jgi:hypothetical protein